MSSLDVGGFIREEYEKVIHVDDQPSFGNHVLEEVIHEMLEHGRRVVEAEEHDGGFK